MTASTSELYGVILAAGKGSRMARLPTALPKCVLPVLDRPILAHQLDLLAALGIRQVYIVVGHRGFEIVREIERLPACGLKIEYVEQRETLGIAHCLGGLEPLLDRPFLLMLGDIFLRRPRLAEMLERFDSGKVDAVLSAVHEEHDEALCRNFCIVEGNDGFVRRVVEKPRHPPTRLKGVGAYLFTPVIFDAVRRTPRTAMRDEYEITDSIQILINDGYRVRIAQCVDGDVNLTVPADLLDINLDALRDHGQLNLISPSAEVSPQARLSSAIVGDGATVEAGAELSECVVFPAARVSGNARLRRAIVTCDGVCTV
ncbi:MAG: NTP transferase domain-containing protein [Pirellulales bacterium]|nr:NTP transferase domain-containing protein [Pirellulales bacterium]